MKIGEWIAIPIIIGVLAIIAVFVIPNQEPTYNENVELENIEEIDQKLEDIKKIADENEYVPAEREWITSGPFQIDRSKYVLGEKIFLRIGGLGIDEKGQISFLRPLNSTHYSVYITVPFDGAKKDAFNYYVEPQLSKIWGYCTVDDFVGEWRVVFQGTDYPNLEFEITEKMLPGTEDKFKPVC